VIDNFPLLPGEALVGGGFATKEATEDFANAVRQRARRHAH
jgi:hypothetical protein